MKNVNHNYLMIHFQTCGAVGTDQNTPAADKDLLAKRVIFIIPPNSVKALNGQITHLVLGILIKAAGDNPAIPGDERIDP